MASIRRGIHQAAKALGAYAATGIDLDRKSAYEERMEKIREANRSQGRRETFGYATKGREQAFEYSKTLAEMRETAGKESAKKLDTARLGQIRAGNEVFQELENRQIQVDTEEWRLAAIEAHERRDTSKEQVPARVAIVESHRMKMGYPDDPEGYAWAWVESQESSPMKAAYEAAAIVDKEQRSILGGSLRPDKAGYAAGFQDFEDLMDHYLDSVQKHMAGRVESMLKRFPSKSKKPITRRGSGREPLTGAGPTSFYRGD